MNSFKDCHPFVIFLYFAAQLTSAMIFDNPLFVAVSLASSLINAVLLFGASALRFFGAVCFPTMLLTAIFNPLFNHRGNTVLAYFPSGNPLTLESVLYGAAFAAMLGSVICGFFSFNKIFTSDMLIYLFSYAVPELSLFVSMLLRFIPLFSERIHTVRAARRALGQRGGGLVFLVKEAVAVFRTAVEWSLEHAAEAADSMRSRGYGTGKRTSFSNFTFRREDAFLSAQITISVSVLYLCRKNIRYIYFPIAAGGEFSFSVAAVLAIYALLCLIPALNFVKGVLVWNKSRSKM